MGQNIKIRDNTYTGAEMVDIPLAEGGGTAEFWDLSDATLSAAGQMLNGVKARGADGTLYTGNIASKTSSDLSASGDTVTAPAGYYATNATKAVAAGSATAPATITGTSASVSTGTNTLTLSKTISVTPTVSAGYVSAGTAGNSNVSLTASVTTKGATTYHPSTSDQTISASQYLTGAQTIKAVTYSGLSASNIVEGVTVKIGDADDDDRIVSVSGSAQIPIISYDTTTHVLSIS